MTPPPPPDLQRCCLHTATLRQWTLPQTADHLARAGLRGITVWRDALTQCGISEARKVLRDSGLEVVSLCRGGFFPARDPSGRQSALDDNRRAIEEAVAIGAPLLVLVCGAVPGQPLEESRLQIEEGINALLPEIEDSGVRLAIEPLHPMYAADRSAINTIAQGNTLISRIGHPEVGLAIDVYHLWWDPDLEEGIRQCGALGRIFAFHVSDWRTPTRDLLLDRAIMGQGCIDIPRIRSWVEEAGFSGPIEVEIFSSELWQTDPEDLLKRILQAYRTAV